MGKTIEELFKTKQLPDGVTAAEKYEIRDAKEMLLRSSTGAMDLPFKVAQIARRNLSSRLKETRIEQEVTGLRIIAKAGAPIIYGTDIVKLSTQKTEMVTAMKNSVNPNNSADNGLIGNLVDKVKAKGQELLTKIGVQLPVKLIPTKISLNADFKAGKEPDTMATLAKIKNDGAGNLVGKLLAQNVKGTPKQIGNQVLGAGINLLKGEIKKKLFGAPKQGAQNLAKKGDSEIQYDSSARYSDTINPNDEDYFKRNDLSSVLVAKETKQLGGGPAVNKRIDELVPRAKDVLNTSKNPFAKIGDKLKDVKKGAEEKLSEAKKQGQQAIAAGKKIGDTKEGASATSADANIKYSETVDETSDDIKLRNDLSSKLEALNTAAAALTGNVGSVQTPNRKVTYSTIQDNRKDPVVTLKTKLGIDNGGDFLNEKTQYVPNDDTKTGLKLKKGGNLDDYDFIPFKFQSITSVSTEVVNFRATLTGITETVSPSWDSAKFIGSPFSYYTYSGIERSLAFNFKIYSTTPAQHIAAWQRINFLTGLAYPQGYRGGTFTPPFIKLTIGNLYKNKECFIESLSYTIDDNGGWEIGALSGKGDDNAKFTINGETTSIDNYKLPVIIDVSVTVKLIESKSTTSAKNYYGFDKLPRTKNKAGKAITTETTSTSNEKATDINNTDQLEQLEEQPPVDTQPKENIEPANSPQNNAGAQTTTQTKEVVENAAAPEVPKPPSYKVDVRDTGDGFEGKVYADGELVKKQNYWSGYAHFGDGGTKEGADGVRASLMFEARYLGFYNDNGKKYPKSENVS